MRCRRHRYHLLCNINTYRQTFFINVRKMLNKFFFTEMTAIEINMFSTGFFHFTINSSCNNISWRQIFSFIILRHKRFAFTISKNATITTNCFGN